MKSRTEKIAPMKVLYSSHETLGSVIGEWGAYQNTGKVLECFCGEEASFIEEKASLTILTAVWPS